MAAPVSPGLTLYVFGTLADDDGDRIAGSNGSDESTR